MSEIDNNALASFKKIRSGEKHLTQTEVDNLKTYIYLKSFIIMERDHDYLKKTQNTEKHYLRNTADTIFQPGSQKERDNFYRVKRTPENFELFAAIPPPAADPITAEKSPAYGHQSQPLYWTEEKEFLRLTIIHLPFISLILTNIDEVKSAYRSLAAFLQGSPATGWSLDRPRVSRFFIEEPGLSRIEDLIIGRGQYRPVNRNHTPFRQN